MKKNLLQQPKQIIMELTIEHLAPYLPYGLKGIQEVNGLIWWLHKESNICRTEDNYHSISVNDFLIFELKPILRPLSDLNRTDIEVGSEKYEGYFHFLDEKYYTHTRDIKHLKRVVNEDERWVYSIPWYLMNHLFEWHFDVFGLIESGLAIDINTLNK